MELGEPSCDCRAGSIEEHDFGLANVLFAIVPRRGDRIFDKQPFQDNTTPARIMGSAIRDRLPRWRRPLAARMSLDRQSRIKGFEHRLYVDLCTKVNGRWLAQKKMSVLCLYRRPGCEYLPATNVAITLSLSPAESELSIDGGDNLRTNDQGIAQFGIAHQLVRVPKDRRTIRLKAVADVPKLSPDGNSMLAETERVETDLEIELVRNDAVGRIEDIFGDPENPNSADRIWVNQPAQADDRNEAIRDLQEALNEVVTRHRGAAIVNNRLLDRSGIFDEATRKYLAEYLSNFRNIAGPGYPYQLGQIGPDPDLLTYIKEDYAPFDPTSKENQGKIVDRRLLIGERLDTEPNKIDGLWELYEGVVRVLQSQMRAFGQTYLDCDLFWLHRSMHAPYAAAQDLVFACHQDGVQLHVEPNDNSAFLTQAWAAVTLATGDHLLVTDRGPDNWYQVRHDAGLGWVRVQGAIGRVVKNDAGRHRAPGDQARNSGLHGSDNGGFGAAASYRHMHTVNGVAYTYGGKQTPDEWRRSLLMNPRALPDKIVNYGEYAANQLFGATKAEIDAKNYSHMRAGCDCGGFVQNCITHSLFPGTDIRIVPREVCPSVTESQIMAKHFVGANSPARKVALNAKEPDQFWIRGADIARTDGHVVMIAEDVPNMTSGEFKIMHECGIAAADPSVFRRKAVRSPFNWWKKDPAHHSIWYGKVSIWQ